MVGRVTGREMVRVIDSAMDLGTGSSIGSVTDTMTLPIIETVTGPLTDREIDPATILKEGIETDLEMDLVSMKDIEINLAIDLERGLLRDHAISPLKTLTADTICSTGTVHRSVPHHAHGISRRPIELGSEVRHLRGQKTKFTGLNGD